MKTDERLYGLGVIPLPVPDYVIKDRIFLLNIRLDAEQNRDMMVRDFTLITELTQAKAFWQKINTGGR